MQIVQISSFIKINNVIGQGQKANETMESINNDLFQGFSHDQLLRWENASWKHKYNEWLLSRIITLSIMCEDSTKENGRECK